MAGEATIGALRVILGADTAKLETNLKEAVSGLESFAKKALTIATGIQIEKVFEQSFKAIVESITGAIDAADKLSKASQKFGVPVDTLAALSNAAALSDVSVEELGSSLAKLTKSMVAASGPTSDQALAFKALGISVRDSSGNLKSVDDIISLVANRFATFRDGTNKTALAIAIFGRAGQDMIPILDQGAAGIEKLKDRMRELNPNLDADALTAEKFKDSMKELHIATDAVILRIVSSSGLLPALDSLSKTMVDLIADNAKLADISNEVAKAMQLAGAAVKVYGDLIAIAVTPTRAFFTALVELSQGNFSAALAAIKDNFAAIPGRVADAFGALKELNKSAQDFTYIGLSDELMKAVLAQTALANAPSINPQHAKDLKAFNDELKKLHDQTLDASGVFAGQLAPGFLAATSGMELLKGQVTIVNDKFVTLGPLAQKLNDEMIKLEGLKLSQEFLTPWQQYEQQIIRINLLLAKQPEIAALAAKKAALTMELAYEEAAAFVVSNVASAFQDIARINKDYAVLAKAAAIAEATVNTLVGYTKALATVPEPFTFPAAAAVIAAGLAKVALIAATPMAKGGSFMVPGGVNSLDRQMVPLALSAGERVDVTPSSQVRDRGGRPREVVLSGLGPRDFFTGDMLRGLVDALNQGERDGYHLKFAER